MRQSKLPRPPTRPVETLKCEPRARRTLTEEEKQARKDKLAASAAEKAQRAAEYAEAARASQPAEPSGSLLEEQLFDMAKGILEPNEDDDDEKLAALDKAVGEKQKAREDAKRERENDWAAGARSIAQARLEAQQREQEERRLSTQRAEAKAALRQRMAAKKQVAKDKAAATRRRNGTSKPTNTHVAIWDDQENGSQIKTEEPLAPVTHTQALAWCPPSDVATEDM